MNSSPSLSTPSILGRLRALTPRRSGISFGEALQVAERQAVRLHELLGAEIGVQESGIASLPRIAIHYEDIPASGMSHWNGQQWVITLNRTESWARQRFTLCHEFKHIIDHGNARTLYMSEGKWSADQQAERIADYFAGCALVPRRQLKAAWGSGIQRLADLAAYFGVSERAMSVRLGQTGLSAAADTEPTRRCARPISTDRGTPQRFRKASRYVSQRGAA
jgi:Zn-dependent peptidase ImmA (M78 family)